MNLEKSRDYFNPDDLRGQCHIIGCGSVGSAVAEYLVRLGVTNISLYDFDYISSHNLANQMFFNKQIKTPKVTALKDILVAINPDCNETIKIYDMGWEKGTRLNGYVFLCVDNIDLRREIVKENINNRAIKAMFDFRTGLEEAQHYAADWADIKQIETLLKTMEYSHDEAKASVPVTACNIEIGVSPTVRLIAGYGIVNFMNFIRKKTLKTSVMSNIFDFDVEAF